MILILILILLVILNCILIVIILNRNNKKIEKFNNIKVIDEFNINKNIIENFNSNNKIDIPIFYINLDRSIDRKKYMEDQFKKFNINNYTRISALDGNKIKNTSKDEIDDIYFINNYKNLLKNEIGCLLSHIKTIKKAYEDGHKEVLILEDDTSLSLMYFWEDKLSNIIKKNVLNDWEIIQLYSPTCNNLNTNENKFTKNNSIDDNNCCWSTTSYLINKKGMEKILNNINYNPIILGNIYNNKLYPFKGQADIFLYALTNTYCSNVPLFYPNINIESTITSNLNKNIEEIIILNLNNVFNYYLLKEKLQFIPKIIHQTWKTNFLPDCYDRWSTHIKEMHPDWKYILWTDEDNRNFIKENYSWFLDIYDTYDKNIKKVDAVRYFLLYHYGGIYIDMDMTTIKRLDDLILNKKNCIFGYQLKNKDLKGSVANAFMISPPKHPFFKTLILDLKTTKEKPVLEATGPSYLTDHIKQYKNNDITIYDMPIIYSTEWDNKDSVNICDNNFELCKTKFPDSYLITFWTGSWVDEEHGLKYKLKKYIPKKNINDYNQLVPKNIFKILLLEDDELPLVPEYLFNCIKSWTILNPEYNFILFDKNDCINFLKTYFDENVLKAFNKVRPFSYKCDLMRLCLLYIYGGVYSDIRMTLLKPLKDIIKNDIDFICTVDKQINNISPLANGFLVSVPKHLFIKKSIDTIVYNILNEYYGNTPLDPTGPTAFGLTINKIINNNEIVNKNFTQGVYNFKTYKYELLNLKFVNKDKVFITQNQDDIILVKPKKDKINTDFKNSNIYWEMWKNKDIYN